MKMKFLNLIFFSFLMILCSLGFAKSFSFEKEMKFPMESSTAFSFVSGSNSLIYFLERDSNEVRVYGSNLNLVNKFKYKKKDGQNYWMKADEMGNIVVFPVPDEGKGQIYDKEGKLIAEPTISDFKYIAFHDGVVYDRKTGYVFFKIDPKTELGQKLFLDNFKVIRNDHFRPVKIQNENTGTIINLPIIKGFHASELQYVDFDENIYFLYENYPPPGVIGRALDNFGYRFKTLVFDKNLSLISTLDGNAPDFDEKAKSFIKVSRDSNNSLKFDRWKYNP